MTTAGNSWGVVFLEGIIFQYIPSLLVKAYISLKLHFVALLTKYKKAYLH